MMLYGIPKKQGRYPWRKEPKTADDKPTEDIFDKISNGFGSIADKIEKLNKKDSDKTEA